MDKPVTDILNLLLTTDPEHLEQLEDRVDIIRHKLKYLENRPSVLCIGSFQPLMLAGGYVPALIEIAGGRAVLYQVTIAQSIQWNDIQRADPEIIVMMPADLTMDQTLKGVGFLLNQPDFADLKAIKNNRLYIADGSRYFYHSDQRMIDSLEILAEIINPKQFIFGYEGEGWMKFSL